MYFTLSMWDRTRKKNRESSEGEKKGAVLLFSTMCVSGLVLVFVLSHFKPESSGTLRSYPVLSSRGEHETESAVFHLFSFSLGSLVALQQRKEPLLWRWRRRSNSRNESLAVYMLMVLCQPH